MHSFLGVPIVSRGRSLGQIYLTDKVDGTEFDEDDERVIEMLAAYAAVAIENARLYQEVVSRDKALKEQFDDLNLLHKMAKALARAATIEKNFGVDSLSSDPTF